MSITYGHDRPDAGQWADQLGVRDNEIPLPPEPPDDDGPAPSGPDDSSNNDPISVVEFPRLQKAALQGTVGEIIDVVKDYTEAHEAAILAHLLARFGATVGNSPHVFAANTKHPARISPLIVGKTSVGAKGTSAGVANALMNRAENSGADALRCISGLSSGEGLIEAVRDERGDNPDAKNFDEGITDKRLLVEEPEFASTLTVMDRQGNILSRILREAWDGGILRTTTRNPLTATGAHISVVGHVTPGELRIRMSDAQVDGGTMNRFLPIASRRTKLLPDGGNIPKEVLDWGGKVLAKRVKEAKQVGRVERTSAAEALWHKEYRVLRRERPDGPVAKILARAVPQVLRLSLVYALLDGHQTVDTPHLKAALALWDYAEKTAGWMLGAEIDTSEIDGLVNFIADAGDKGRTKTEIANEHFSKHKKADEIEAMLKPLIADGRVRQEVDKSGRGRPTTRYYV